MKNNNNIKSITDNRRKFFKIAGVSSGSLLLWNMLPKSIFAKTETLGKDNKINITIHPNAISRKERK